VGGTLFALWLFFFTSENELYFFSVFASVTFGGKRLVGLSAFLWCIFVVV
jgi:hypothetical protein